MTQMSTAPKAEQQQYLHERNVLTQRHLQELHKQGKNFSRPIHYIQSTNTIFISQKPEPRFLKRKHVVCFIEPSTVHFNTFHSKGGYISQSGINKLVMLLTALGCIRYTVHCGYSIRPLMYWT